MLVTIFRNRLLPGNQAEYYDSAEQMSEIARSMPGYVSHKTFTAEDGERVTIAEFADEESQRRWATEMRHVEAKKRGRAAFYAEYKVQVCEVKRESAFKAETQAKQEA
jgi:heme-degrading monooxygenase HmoA